MIDFAAQTDLIPRAGLIAALLPLGMLVGVVHFATLRRSAGLMAQARTTKALLLMAARFALTAGVLVLASLEGATPLLVTSAGLMLGRAAVLRRERQRAVQ